jgi:hypothetical protein
MSPGLFSLNPPLFMMTSMFKKQYFMDKRNSKMKHFYQFVTIILCLNERKMAYIEINKIFGFFNMEEIDNEILREKSKQLVAIYSEDLESNLENEIIQFKTIVKHFSEEEKLSMHNLLEALTISKLNDSFPNVETALKNFISIPCSNASGERSFSVLKIVKNYQITSLSNENMSSLALMSIENCILQSMDWNNLIKEFASQKPRKKL